MANVPQGDILTELESPFWSGSIEKLFEKLSTNASGLSSEEARRRAASAKNVLKMHRAAPGLSLFFAQFKSPIILILLFAATLSFFLREPVDAVIILTIVLTSGLLGFWQERGATQAVEKLLSLVQVKATVLRDGKPGDVPFEDVVPGDVVILNAGDSIPADCRILEAKDLFVDEAALTGESFPVEKEAAAARADAPLARRANALFLGTHVTSGTAKAVAVHTGKQTELGRISEQLKWRPPMTEFERGIRRFGYMLMEITLVLVLAIFAVNVFLARPVLDSFLFALALAVGLTPQLLPAIISVNLSHGAKRMAERKVIVKRLASIENFGSMDVFCSDKTGTLTEGTVRLQTALDADGNENEEVFRFAYLNAFYQTGFTNPIDEAICAHHTLDVAGYQKLDEVPYDFTRKRLSVLVAKNGKQWIITKGAFAKVLGVCSFARRSGAAEPIAESRDRIMERFKGLSAEGLRVLGLAFREVEKETFISREGEKELTFLGFLVFSDQPKKEVAEAVQKLRVLGISLKIITGDNALVAAQVAKEVGLSSPTVITGSELARLRDEALIRRAKEAEVFAEVEPSQKERIITALRQGGHVVGFMGDGINDAPAMHAADVSISVDRAVDVAKEAADIVLLEKNLTVLAEGVEEGRRTFANTLKYVFMATSANFGNMFSMAGASFFLPFLPLLPKQILLTNLLTDLPEMNIATDRVDGGMIERPRRWDIGFIRRFMLTFGLLSSVFDFLTFGVLLWLLRAGEGEFRTGWFAESVISASLIVLVIRTRKFFLQSPPGKPLAAATVLVVLAALSLPYTPLGKVFGFTPLPAAFLSALAWLVAAYVIAAEIVKARFYRRVSI